jgi:hypothetical protein
LALKVNFADPADGELQFGQIAGMQWRDYSREVCIKLVSSKIV